MATFYVFKNYGFTSEECFIETPSESDAMENFRFAYETAKPGDLIELAAFAESGEYIVLDSYREE